MLRRRWKVLRTQAFHGAGQRLAVRLQAGLLLGRLGRLGDTIRYERRARSGAPGDWGLRPCRALWAAIRAENSETNNCMSSQ